MREKENERERKRGWGGRRKRAKTKESRVPESLVCDLKLKSKVNIIFFSELRAWFEI